MAFKLSVVANMVLKILKGVNTMIPAAARLLEGDSHPQVVRIGKVLEVIGEDIQFALDLLAGNDAPTPERLASVVPDANA